MVTQKNLTGRPTGFDLPIISTREGWACPISGGIVTDFSGGVGRTTKTERMPNLVLKIFRRDGSNLMIC